MSGAKHNVNPADYGWTYLGSNAQSRVEYWVNDQGAKMDYYPTTGAIGSQSDSLMCIVLHCCPPSLSSCSNLGLATILGLAGPTAPYVEC